MSTDVIPYAERVGALSVQDVRSQVSLIQHVMREVMKKDEHYGVIPGTNKPTLLKAGAEKLCLTFRLDPEYEITTERDGVHLTITSKCTLFHIPSSQRFGSGMGSCSTRESKYAYRNMALKCPDCGKEAIIKGKAEFGGGWLCFKKKGGCGAKFPDDAQQITGQPKGRVPNEDIADTYNTVLKMANKRSLVAAVLNATAASDIFTQDMEDTASAEVTVDMPQPEPTGKIGLEQAMNLAKALHECDAKAEADFLVVAKIARLDELPAADADEAFAWVKRRAEKRGKKAA